MYSHPYDIQRRGVRIARALNSTLEPLVGMEAIAYRGSIVLKTLIRLGDEAYAISPGKRAYSAEGAAVGFGFAMLLAAEFLIARSRRTVGEAA